jgi:DNA-binding NarL/FixJ family response regulator
MIRVLVFEERSAIAREVVTFLNGTQGCQVTEQFNKLSDLEMLMTGIQADVVLMGLVNPLLRSAKLLREIKQVHPKTKVVIFTQQAAEKTVLEMLRAGADGYILIGTSPVQVFGAVMEVIQDGVPMTPSVARTVFRSFSMVGIGANSRQSSLTFREKEVLHLLVQGRSYKLVSHELSISIDTVRTHVRHIYDKLKVSSKSEAVAKAILNHLV